MYKIFLKLSKGLIKNFAVLASGTIIAQLLTILSAPIFSRIYSTEQIGIYTLVYTVVSIFGSVICGRYEMIIIANNDDEEAIALSKGAFEITIVFSILITIAYYFYVKINNIIPIKNMYNILSAFPILICVGLSNILSSYNNRMQDYKILSRVNIIRSLLVNILNIVLGLFNPKTINLIISQIVSNITGIIIQRKNVKKYFKNISQKKVNIVLKKYRYQLIYSVPAVLSATASYSLMNIFISKLYGLSDLGLYSLSFRILGIPLAITSGNFSQLFLKEGYTEYLEKGNIKDNFKKFSILTFLIALPMVIIMEIISPLLYSKIFGYEWIKAGLYIKYLAPMYGIRLVVASMSTCLIILNKQKNEFFIQTIYLIVSIIIYIAAKNYLWSIDKYLKVYNFIFTIIYILYYAMLFLSCRKVIKKNN